MFQSIGRELAPSASEFWQANTIPHSPLYPRVEFAQWLHTDSEENYHRRGNRAFSRDSVGYRFNSLGYRGPEFEREVGDAAVMFVGDSNTFGLGMPYDRLWTSLVTRSLQDQLGRPVRQYNLGFGATGSDYAAMIVHQSIDVLHPDAVCVLWPSLARITWFPHPRRQVFFLPEWQPTIDAEEHAAFLRLATEAQAFFNFVRNFQLVRARLNELGIPFFWGHLDQIATASLQEYTTLVGYVGYWQALDLARDGRHAGIDSHAAFAAAMLDVMESNGFGISETTRSFGATPAKSQPNKSNVGARESTGMLSRRVLEMITRGRLRRRIRAMKRRDPFIY